MSIPAALGSNTGRFSRPIFFLRVFLCNPRFALTLLGFSGCLDMLPFSSPLQATAKLRTQDDTLLIGINPPACSGCNHCMTHGTWDHAPNRAHCTTVAPAYFRCPSLVAGC